MIMILKNKNFWKNNGESEDYVWGHHVNLISNTDLYEHLNGSKWNCGMIIIYQGFEGIPVFYEGK